MLPNGNDIFLEVFYRYVEISIKPDGLPRSVPELVDIEDGACYEILIYAKEVEDIIRLVSKKVGPTVTVTVPEW